MVEFALVLFMKEMNDRRLKGSSLAKEPESGRVISKHLTEVENTAAKISTDFKNDLKKKEFTEPRKAVIERRQKSFGTHMPKFVEASSENVKVL